MSRPVIGITLDHIEGGGYSDFPWYAIRENYASCVEQFGATVVMLPYANNSIEKYLDLLDGLVLTGGDFDIHPKFYGQEITSAKVSTKDKRTLFEIELCKGAISRKMPILGICAGHQLLNVVCGGNLIQHIPDEVPSEINHEQPKPKNVLTHDVLITPGTKLHSVVGKTGYKVNTTHHQAVKDLGKNLIMSAKAPDGIIEAIEHKDLPFCIGVEWHPEYLACEEDIALMKAFVEACKNDRS
jgi:putative glutamine amidotransferase